MIIDWFTVGAQALNFLILVWLMKRFLYKPILHAIDERERRIAVALADANAKKTAAQKERDEFQHKNEELGQQRAELLNKAADEARAERQRLLDEARKESDTERTRWQEALRTEHLSLRAELTRRTREEVFAITRKTLADLATTSLEERLSEVFIRRLREMDGQAKEGLADALKTSSGPALLRSTFDLPAEQRAAIHKALNEIFSTETRVQFETAPDLVSGIELTTNGHKMGWSIADYLAALERSVDNLLKEKNKLDAKVEPKPEVHAEPKRETKSQ